jgi:hypothetical protein
VTEEEEFEAAVIILQAHWRRKLAQAQVLELLLEEAAVDEIMAEEADAVPDMEENVYEEEEEEAVEEDTEPNLLSDIRDSEMDAYSNLVRETKEAMTQLENGYSKQAQKILLGLLMETEHSIEDDEGSDWRAQDGA